MMDDEAMVFAYDQAHTMLAMLMWRFSRDNMVTVTREEFEEFFRAAKQGKAELLIRGHEDGRVDVLLTDRDAAAMLIEFGQQTHGRA